MESTLHTLEAKKQTLLTNYEIEIYAVTEKIENEIKLTKIRYETEIATKVNDLKEKCERAVEYLQDEKKLLMTSKIDRKYTPKIQDVEDEIEDIRKKIKNKDSNK